jgi:glutamine synthetase
MSTVFRHFLAGLLHCLPWMMPMLAPNVNSYKRLVENYWAPVKVCWAMENRTAAVRVITPKSTGLSACSPSGTRAEMRVSGADINVPLALSACFAAGFYGIRHSLPLPAPIAGDVMKEQQQLERLPKTLFDAAMKMSQPNSVARELFGSQFVDHYCGTRLEEWSQWEREVTNWETRRYFELV